MFQSGASVEHFEELREKLVVDEARTIAIYSPLHRIVFAASFSAALVGSLTMMHVLYMSL